MEYGSPPHNDQSGMMNLEIHSGKKMFNLINIEKVFRNVRC